MNSSSSAKNIGKRPKRTLRSTVIEPFKQIKIGLYVIGLCIFFLLVIGSMFLKAFMEQYAHVMEIFDVVDSSGKWDLILNDVFYSNAIWIGSVFLIFIIVIFIVVFKMTHKIYGPLVSIERFITAITNGHYERRVSIRSGDELGRLVSKLNIMAEELEKRHKKAEL